MGVDMKFRYAAALSNAAVALMEKGEMHQAVGLLEESLLRCEQAVRQQNVVRTTCSVSTDTSSCANPEVGNRSMHASDNCSAIHQSQTPESTRSRCAAIIPARLIGLQDTFEYSENETSHFVDWRALKLKIDVLDLTSESFFLTWVITYNAAMCYHFLGLGFSARNQPNERKYALVKAITNYGFVHQMMANDQELQGDVWMLLVVVNNLSRAQLALGDFRRSAYCSKRLLAILMYIHDHEEMIMPKSLFEKYLSNVEGLILCERRTASAA